MKKLKLDLDALQVESFEAERRPEARGTVQAHFTTGPLACQGQCVTDAGCGTARGCVSYGCASEHCSARECNSLSGCVSYEVPDCSL